MSAEAAVLVPDWLTTFSTSWRFWRIWFWSTVVSAGTPPLPPPIGVGRADDAEDVAAVGHVVGVGRQDAGATGRRRLGMAVGVVAQDERHRRHRRS